MNPINSAKLKFLCREIQVAFINGKATRVAAADRLKVSQQTMGRYVKAPQTMTATHFFALLDHLEIEA